MGCDWYNDGDEPAELTIQMRSKTENGELIDTGGAVVTVPPGGKVYLEELRGGEVKRR